MDNLFIVINSADTDNNIALPYSEEALKLLMNSISVDKKSSWRGDLTFTKNTKKIYFSIVKDDTILDPPAPITE